MKLYTLVRKDLNPSQQAVQAGHAVAEYLLRGPSTEWDNGTLIYLGVENEFELERWKLKLDKRGITYLEFREPDIGNQITAISAVDDGRAFSNLELLRLGE
ncbi:MAG: hypothetical protein KAS32_13595 [Candidatus Peribacteraceae bacterium]|nr:hypothetical protein [Candidatus Peribacteraceae bacterium]